MRLRTVIGAAGVLATAVAALAVVGAELAPVADAFDPLVTALGRLGPRGLVLASVVVAALGLLVSLLVPGEERVLADDGAAERFEELLGRPPEGVTRGAPRTGGALDDDVARAVAGNDRALSAVEERLRELAVALLAGADDGADPAELVATGAWTDDRTAAAFLASEGPTPSLRSRVRLWLDPETERERRIRRTADALERVAVDASPVGRETGDPTGERANRVTGRAGDDRPGGDRPADGGESRAERADVDAGGGRA